VEGYFADPSDVELERLVETRLAYEIEDPVHKFLPNFSDVSWTMSDLQRQQMTRYITLLFGRCAARRAAEAHLQDIKIYALNKFLSNESQLLTVAMHWSINAFPKGLRFTVKDVALGAKRLAAGLRSPSAAQQSFVKSVLGGMTIFDEAMYHGDWRLVRTTDDDPFILSDTPFVTWHRVPTGEFSYGISTSIPNVEVVLPISPLACLHILPRVKRTLGVLIPTVQEINIAQAAFAHHACFANQNKKELDDVMQRYAHTVQLGRNAFTLWHRNFDDLFFDILMR